MRVWLIAVMLVAACKSAKDKGETAAPAASKVSLPKVTVATVLAADAPPPFLLFVDDSDTVRVAAAASWTEVATTDVSAKAKKAGLDSTDRMIRETYGLGQQPARALADWDPGTDIDLAALEDKGTNPNGAKDDPPPPEEEDRPDDGADESGGTGTAMALEEGKMGKKDSDRAEGQYKMKKAGDEPAPRNQQMRGPVGAFGRFPNQNGTPSRLADVVGEVAENGKLDDVRSVILAPPTLKATKLIAVVTRLGAAIGVVHDGTVRPLRINFASSRDGYYKESPYWLEARITPTALVIEAVPDVPIDATLDPKALAAAIAKARTARGADATAPVDVLVDAGVDTQRLVDVLVALDTAGERVIGMGHAPSAEELKLRGHRNPTVSIGQPNAVGDLDKAEIRKVIRANQDKILACYTKLLATQPDLSGTVSAQFFISPKGTVASATAAGVDPALATCVAGVVKALVFPKPKGGGGVQVNYPFTMRP